jgi:hypothetical protein
MVPAEPSPHKVVAPSYVREPASFKGRPAGHSLVSTVVYGMILRQDGAVDSRDGASSC